MEEGHLVMHREYKGKKLPSWEFFWDEKDQRYRTKLLRTRIYSLYWGWGVFRLGAYTEKFGYFPVAWCEVHMTKLVMRMDGTEIHLKKG